MMKKLPHKTENPLLKECLFTALIKLMDQKDFKDIKISEIAQKAGVSRMTYYRTYESKEDILIQYFQDQSQLIRQTLQDCPDYTTYDVFCLFFTYFKEQGYLMKYLYQADLLREVAQRFVEAITQGYEHSRTHMISEEYKTYEISFMAGGLFLILLRWLELGSKETPEEMAQMTMQMLRIDQTKLS